jgi:hypothetical protein
VLPYFQRRKITANERTKFWKLHESKGQALDQHNEFSDQWRRQRRNCLLATKVGSYQIVDASFTQSTYQSHVDFYGGIHREHVPIANLFSKEFYCVLQRKAMNFRRFKESKDTQTKPRRIGCYITHGQMMPACTSRWACRSLSTRLCTLIRSLFGPNFRQNYCSNRQSDNKQNHEWTSRNTQGLRGHSSCMEYSMNIAWV